VNMKVCTKCNIPKPFPTEFYKDRRIKSGYAARCCDCDKKYPRKIYRCTFRKRHPEYQKQRSQSHSYPLTERQKEYRKTEEWRKKERDYRRSYLSNRRKTDPKYIIWKAEKDRLYRSTEKGKMRNARSKACRKRRDIIHNLTSKEWANILFAFDEKCAYCGSSTKITIDHFIPLFYGGQTVKGNIVPACNICNSRKQAKLPSEWCTNEQFIRVRDILKSL